jgi:hypothetical protein
VSISCPRTADHPTSHTSCCRALVPSRSEAESTDRHKREPQPISHRQGPSLAQSGLADVGAIRLAITAGSPGVVTGAPYPGHFGRILHGNDLSRRLGYDKFRCARYIGQTKNRLTHGVTRLPTILESEASLRTCRCRRGYTPHPPRRLEIRMALDLPYTAS